MSRMIEKNSNMPRYGRKEIALRRFGSMTNFYDQCKPMVGDVFKSVQHFARVLDNQPCTTKQSAVMEAAIDYYLDRPTRIIKEMEKRAELGKTSHTIKIADYVCLRASLRIDTPI